MKEWICEEVPAMTLDGKVVSTMLHQEQELVRCKDCKAWKQYDDLNLGGCELFPEYNKMGDWFCNFGERKEGDGDV